MNTESNYKTKLDYVQAVQMDLDPVNQEDAAQWCGGQVSVDWGLILFTSGEQENIVNPTDYIVKSENGDFFVYTAQDFENIFEEVAEEEVVLDRIQAQILMHKGIDLSTKDISDGYHTFGDLYHHRAILFASLLSAHKDLAWKSWKHHDGTMFDGMFIVGIQTPDGQYSYHYNPEYWDVFKDIEVLDFAPEYDGHKPEDIGRLLSLQGALK